LDLLDLRFRGNILFLNRALLYVYVSVLRIELRIFLDRRRFSVYRIHN
jgi:hypothetical protein